MKPEHKQCLEKVLGLLAEARIRLELLQGELPNYSHLIGNEFAGLSDDEKTGSELRDNITGILEDYIAVAEGDIDDLLIGEG